MEPQINESQSVIEPLKKVTPVSKYLAMALFIILPFGGFWLGLNMMSNQDPIVMDMAPNEEPMRDTVEVSPTSLSISTNNLSIDYYDQELLVQLDNLKQSISENTSPAQFTEIKNVQFIHQGISGSVTQVCWTGSVVQEVYTDRKHQYCNGLSAVLMQYDGRQYILGTSTNASIAEYKILKRTVSDNRIENNTTPNTIGNYLVLAFTDLACVGVWGGDLCEDAPGQNWMVVDFDSMKTSHISGIPGNYTVFVNHAQSKAILVDKDRFGGSYQLWGLNFSTLELIPISESLSANAFPSSNNIIWETNDTVVVNGVRYNF